MAEERTQKSKFWIPSEFSLAVTMMVVVISAVVTVLGYFMAEAQVLNLKQQDLRNFAIQVADQVNENTAAIEGFREDISGLNSLILDFYCVQAELEDKEICKNR